jgi:hypothetical protein
LREENKGLKAGEGLKESDLLIHQLQEEIAELREEKGLHWAIRLRKKLLVSGTHEINAVIRDLTAWLELHFPGETEQQPEGKVYEVDEVWRFWFDDKSYDDKDFREYLIDYNYKLIQPQVEEGNKEKEEK